MIAKASVVAAFCACVAGCAGSSASLLTAVSAQRTRDAITIGTSTKADVIAAFGKTKGISFGSGYEVWVYRVTGDMPASPSRGKAGITEFVVLFAPSGVVKKTRIRPPSPPRETKGT